MRGITGPGSDSPRPLDVAAAYKSGGVSPGPRERGPVVWKLEVDVLDVEGLEHMGAARALSGVTTAPEAVKTRFDRRQDQPEVALLLRPVPWQIS